MYIFSNKIKVYRNYLYQNWCIIYLYVYLHYKTKLKYSLMRIKDILKRKNITAKELALQIGMSEAGLSVALSEKGNPSLATLRKIALAIGCEVGDFFIKEETTSLTCPKCGTELELKIKE